MKSPKMVWCAEQQRRNQFCLFLRRFHLDALPDELQFHVFADSLYRLRINGKIAGYGPGRFLPDYPEYDTYDLSPWLKIGDNSILVEVCSRGEPCYQAIESRGGFVAWGDATSATDVHTPGEWRVSESDAWDSKAEPYSFAQSAIEILDTSKLPPGYPEFLNQAPPHGWFPPVEVPDPQHWGALSPRSIGMPSLDTLRPRRVIRASAVEEGYFRIGFNAENVRAKVRQPFFTHIFSPKQQRVDIGLFWGPTFLNGKKLQQTRCAARGNRENTTVLLQAGWNFFYGIPNLLKIFWTWIMEFPEIPGLIVRALPARDCEYSFGLGPCIEPVAEEVDLSAPASLAEITGYPVEWKLIRSEMCLYSPARAMAWDLPSEGWIQDCDYHDDLVLSVNGEAAMLSLDMGTEYLGHVQAFFETENGTTLDIAYADTQEANGTVSLYRSNPYVNSVDRYICGPGTQSVCSYHERGGRFLQLTFRGRPGHVRIHRVEVIQKSGKLPMKGEFGCDDSLFNWTWKTGVDTVRACTSDGWNDGPWRERGMYVGDALITAGCTRKFTDDWRIEPWAIRLWARAQFPNGLIPAAAPSALVTPCSDYTLLWIVLARNYWAATGDAGIVREVWPAIERVFGSSVWKTSHKGLWEVHSDCGMFLDGTALPEERDGVNGCLNAFRIRALECAAELAHVIGLPKESAKYAQEAVAVRKAFREVFWDESSHRFSAALIEGDLFTGPSLHVNTLALAFGLADENQEPGVLEYLKREMHSNTRCERGCLELYFLYYLLLGLYRVGESGLAENVVRQHYSLMKEREAPTFWEHLGWGLQIPSLNSVCHGWASSPLIFFSERILGVRELVPGDMSRILIAPESETLNEASGRVPHPRGVVGVSWKIEGKSLLLSVTLPEDLTATIQPVGRLAELELVELKPEKNILQQATKPRSTRSRSEGVQVA